MEYSLIYLCSNKTVLYLKRCCVHAGVTFFNGVVWGTLSSVLINLKPGQVKFPLLFQGIQTIYKFL